MKARHILIMVLILVLFGVSGFYYAKYNQVKKQIVTGQKDSATSQKTKSDDNTGQGLESNSSNFKVESIIGE